MRKKKDWQVIRFTVLMLALLVAVSWAAWHRGRQIAGISYAEHMDDVAVTIDGDEYQFRDLAFYLAYQEMAIEEQAKVYDLENTHRYWNVYTNGSFLRVEGREAAMNMAVHDVIFYNMAAEDKLELTQEEWDYARNRKTDFWNDLEEEGQKRLGVSEEEINTTFEHMALAQKAQQLLADAHGVDHKEYDVNGSRYQELLQEHTYRINENLWERLKFGSIVMNQ